MFRRLWARWARFKASTTPRDAERHFGDEDTALWASLARHERDPR